MIGQLTCGPNVPFTGSPAAAEAASAVIRDSAADAEPSMTGPCGRLWAMAKLSS